MRFYSCSGLGHKSQDCGSTKKQPLRSFLYSSSRKTSTNEEINIERTDAKKQVWMKKTKQLKIGEADQSREDGFHMESQA